MTVLLAPYRDAAENSKEHNTKDAKLLKITYMQFKCILKFT